ncbi:PH domain-containing protein [Pseudonocardia acaciae]|uniref:PH domain-containing protein n=1 Tax=Pseudonocardia acaciae TaxID=551276 RepID=UPI00049085F7|nr:PH domain-containing protein [Pseudonocardia acaciae]
MDNYAWSAPVAVLVVGWLAAASALAWCALGSGDAPGRVLAGTAVLVLGGGALVGSMARPRLAASRSGVRVRGPLRGAQYGWSEVSRLRLVHTRRFGRDVPSLELEVHDQRLYVFGWLDLGADPRDVADILSTLRAAN